MSRAHLDAFAAELAHLLEDGAQRPRALAAARERDDAEGAHVVAAAHHADERAVVASLSAHRHDVRIGLVEGELRVDREGPLVRELLSSDYQQVRDHPRQPAVGVRAHHQVHRLVLLQQLLFQPLRHAAQHTHQEVFAAPLLLRAQLVQPLQHLVLCVFADRAGVQ